MVDNRRTLYLKTAAIIFGAILLSSTVVLSFSVRNAYALDPDGDLADARSYAAMIPAEIEELQAILTKLERADDSLELDMNRLEANLARTERIMLSSENGYAKLNNLINKLGNIDPALTSKLTAARDALGEIRTRELVVQTHLTEYGTFEATMAVQARLVFTDIQTNVPPTLNELLPAVQGVIACQNNIPSPAPPVGVIDPNNLPNEQALGEKLTYLMAVDQCMVVTHNAMEKSVANVDSFFDVFVEIDDPVLSGQLDLEDAAGIVLDDADLDLDSALRAEELTLDASELSVDTRLNPSERHLVTQIIIIINKLVNFEKAWKLIATQIKLIRTQIFDLIKWVKILVTQAKLIATEIQQLIMKIDILLLAIFDLFLFDLAIVAIFGTCKLDAEDGVKDVAYCPPSFFPPPP